MTPTELAKKVWSNGATSESNPFPKPEVLTPWDEWRSEFLRLNDEYMDLATSDES